jgi:hypothetical protein
MQFGDGALDDVMSGFMTMHPNGSNGISSVANHRPVKRPHNAYNLYFIEQQPIERENNPTLNGNAISQLIGRQWADMDDAAKRPYRQRAKEIWEKFRNENPDYHYQKGSNKPRKSKTNSCSHAAESIVFPELESPEAIEACLGKIFAFLGRKVITHYFANNKEAMEGFCGWSEGIFGGSWSHG